MRLYVIGDSISMHYGPYLERYSGEVFSYSRKTEEEVRDVGLSDKQGANGGDSGAVLEFLSAMIDSGRLKAEVLLFSVACAVKSYPGIRRRRSQGTRP